MYILCEINGNYFVVFTTEMTIKTFKTCEVKYNFKFDLCLKKKKNVIKRI